MSIPPDLSQRLHKTLLRCAPFDSDQALEAVFVDERIGQWIADLPEASSKGGRVRAVIKYLNDKRNTQGENALVLFLHVLYESLAPTDALRQELAVLADELEQYAPTPDTPQWDAALDRYRDWVKRTYGTMRVLGKHEPVSLEGIYTDVYFLEQPVVSRYADLNDLSSEKKGKRLDGLELVRQLDTQILVILGKPGAGKTTFLKHIALQAAAGQLDDRVPIFVALREWAADDDLLDILAESFIACSLADPRAYVEHLLQTGRALLLFDALDEMSEQARSAFIKILERFSRRYLDCHILLTCRTAVTPYQFERSKIVEVANFNDDQIRAFATNWFGEDTSKAEKFRGQIEQDERLRDLGRTPLLLGMLCLTFDERGDFPQKRADLYRQALDTLLVQWDESRNIERDAMRRAEVYHGLSLGQKHQLFAYIARATFEQGKILIPKERLERLLTDYLVTTPNAPARIDMDSAATLKAIEAQHGILVEYAHGVYAFLHPTFQEYYAAYYVVTQAENGDSEAIPRLLIHIQDDRWHEIILLTASILDVAGDFFAHFLDTLDAMMQDNAKLTGFLTWLQRKVNAVTVSYKPPAERALYALLARGRDDPYDLHRTLYLDDVFELARSLARDLDRDFARDEDNYRKFDVYRIFERTFDIGSELDLEWEPDSELQFSDWLLDDYLIQALIRTHDRAFTRVRRLVRLLKLSALYTALSSLSDHDFINSLRAVMIEHRDIGYDWNFTDKQAAILKRYFTTARFLVECLNVANISNADRAAIEDRLLLPPKQNKE